MDYKLALKLKEAGFPQGNYLHEPNGGSNYKNDISEEDREIAVYFPTLSELIEACGDRITLWKSKDNEFIACDGNPQEDIWENWDFTREAGKTPEEAVSKLYLSMRRVSTFL